MSLSQHLFARLPHKTQLAVANRLLDYNILYRMPLMRMFFHTLESFGADRDEMLEALEGASNFNGSFFRSWQQMAFRLSGEAKAHEAAGDPYTAKDKYLRSSIYHLVADWPLDHGPLKHRNYGQAMEAFEQFKRFHIPQIEKVALPYKKGHIMANLRFPEGHLKSRRKPCPAVVIFQGNDSVKEFMVFIEDYALQHGIATLSVDQPGFGESGMSGNLLNSEKAASTCIRNAVNYLTHHPRVDHDAVGAFGFSFGGFTALYSAGLSKNIKAVATIGAPMHLKKVYHGLSFLMKQRTFQWSGCRSDAEVERMLHDMDIRNVFARIQCPSYILHGMEDEVVNRFEARDIRNTVRGPSTLEYVDHGDHTCSTHLDELLPRVFGWMREALDGASREAQEKRKKCKATVSKKATKRAVKGKSKMKKPEPALV